MLEKIEEFDDNDGSEYKNDRFRKFMRTLESRLESMQDSLSTTAEGATETNA